MDEGKKKEEDRQTEKYLKKIDEWRKCEKSSIDQTSANQGSNLRFIDVLNSEALYPKLNSYKSENAILASQ